MDNFAARLREARGEMLQDAFAKEIGVSRASLSAYENGTRIPDVETLRNICEVTGYSAYYLLGLSDSKDDSLAALQRDTGLSEATLEHFASHPMSAKVVNFLAEGGSLEILADRAAILHDEVRWRERNPPEEWSDTLQKIRDEHYEYRAMEMKEHFEAALTMVDLDDELFGIPSDELPTGIAVSMLKRMQEIRNGLLMLAEHDPESKRRVEFYTQAIDAMLSRKEVPDAQETPEQ